MSTSTLPRRKKPAAPRRGTVEVREAVAFAAAMKWLKYAERTLGDGHYPERLSDSAEAWVRDAISELDEQDTRTCGYGDIVVGALGRRAVEIAVNLLYRNPLKYPQTLKHFSRSFRS